MRHVVGSILISKYRSWCTLTFLKCVKKGKLCQNATLRYFAVVFSHPISLPYLSVCHCLSLNLLQQLSHAAQLTSDSSNLRHNIACLDIVKLQRVQNSLVRARAITRFTLLFIAQSNIFTVYAVTKTCHLNNLHVYIQWSLRHESSDSINGCQANVLELILFQC